jgi:NAD dependent epimerase/dehydratase family enzyme
MTATSSAVNLAAPVRLPQRTYMHVLRATWGVPVGLPATKWMAELGAFALLSDTELLLKSRRVVPGRLLEAGFAFDSPQWPEAADDLVRRLRGVHDIHPILPRAGETYPATPPMRNMRKIGCS